MTAKIICIAASLGVFFASNLFAAGTAKICFNATCFQTEIAQSQIEKQHGLMARDDLAENEGMLFVYDHDVRPQFWMKNMRMPLDFVWLDADRKVVDLDENVLACVIGACPTLTSEKAVRYVLEISAASIHHAGIKIGDQATIQQGKTNED